MVVSSDQNNGYKLVMKFYKAFIILFPYTKQIFKYNLTMILYNFKCTIIIYTGRYGSPVLAGLNSQFRIQMPIKFNISNSKSILSTLIQLTLWK